MNKYITEKKIDMAKQLLQEHPDMLVEEICAMCGYNDGRYFSKVFKNRVGITPSEYRLKFLEFWKFAFEMGGLVIFFDFFNFLKKYIDKEQFILYYIYCAWEMHQKAENIIYAIVA